MVSHQIKYFFLLFALIFLSACESDVDLVILPEFKQKLAITAFISPADSILNFFVTSNKRIYGELNTEEPLANLKAFLSNDSCEVALDTTKTGFKISRVKMPVKYGKTYNLNVSNDKGLSAEASCTIPFRRDFFLKADTFSFQRPRVVSGVLINEKIVNLMFTFSDFPDEENYYRVLGNSTSYHTNSSTGKTWESTNPLSFEKEYLIDKGMDGNVFTVRTLDNLSHNYGSDSAFLRIYLLNIEKSYYLYHKSLEDYNFDENPFAEVTPVFSNVTGGLGVFSSYTVDSLFIRLK